MSLLSLAANSQGNISLKGAGVLKWTRLFYPAFLVLIDGYLVCSLYLFSILFNSCLIDGYLSFLFSHFSGMTKSPYLD
jgi:hypothetical protein